jgi:Na+/proline symporter
LFLLLGTALWAAGQAPAGLAGDQIFPRFIVEHLPVGLSGLVMAGILAAAMSTISSSISALASSVTNDLYASFSGRGGPGDEAHLLQVGRWFSLLWGVLLTACALGFHLAASGKDTPVVVLALSIASVTYGALLGAYVLASMGPRVNGANVITGAVVTVVVMLVVVFAARLAAAVPLLEWLAPLGRLAFPWYVPLGTLITVVVALAAATAWPARKVSPTRA